MPFIYGVLCEEYERLQAKRKDYEEKLAQLPKGKIVTKNIKGRNYNYLLYRLEGKVITKYIKKENLESIQSQIERREKLKAWIDDIMIDIRLIEKVIKDEDKPGEER
jgi:hypothetical protein